MLLYLEVSTVNSRVEGDVALCVIEGDHLFPGAADRLPPLEEHLHGAGGGILSCLMDRVVAVVAGSSRTRFQLSDL